MLKKFRLPILALGTALTLLSPAAAFARHHRDEWREHSHRVWRENPPAGVYVGPAYRYGYGHYDRWGYWHPRAGGYYDRWGYYHPCGR
jgi:hypothetical protein